MVIPGSGEAAACGLSWRSGSPQPGPWHDTGPLAGPGCPSLPGGVPSYQLLSLHRPVASQPRPLLGVSPGLCCLLPAGPEALPKVITGGSFLSPSFQAPKEREKRSPDSPAAGPRSQHAGVSQSPSCSGCHGARGEWRQVASEERAYGECRDGWAKVRFPPGSSKQPVHESRDKTAAQESASISSSFRLCHFN